MVDNISVNVIVAVLKGITFSLTDYWALLRQQTVGNNEQERRSLFTVDENTLSRSDHHRSSWRSTSRWAPSVLKRSRYVIFALSISIIDF